MPYKAKQGFQYSIIEFYGEEVYRFKTYSEAMRIEKMLNDAFNKGYNECDEYLHRTMGMV